MTIELYAGNTPNGHRAVVVLEELGLPYELHKVNIFKGEAKTPAIRALNPNARVPVLVDPEGPGGAPIVVTQSWAICLYLGEKTGRFMPADARGRMTVIEWLFQIGTDVMMVHSTLNAVTNFVPDKVESTIAFYRTRLVDALAAVDQRLAQADFLAGPLSVADFAFYPIYNYRRGLIAEAAELANLRRWGAAMDARPGCRRGVALLQPPAA